MNNFSALNALINTLDRLGLISRDAVNAYSWTGYGRKYNKEKA